MLDNTRARADGKYKMPMEALPKMQNPRSRTVATHTNIRRLIWPEFVVRMVIKAHPVSAAGTRSIGSTPHPLTSINVAVVLVGSLAGAPGAAGVTYPPW